VPHCLPHSPWPIAMCGKNQGWNLQSSLESQIWVGQPGCFCNLGGLSPPYAMPITATCARPIPASKFFTFRTSDRG
jgi:hypothetical protein